MPEHVRQVHKPNEECPEHDGRNCWICNLWVCSVCGAFEGALLPECPGRWLTEDENAINYKHYCKGTGPFEEARKRLLKTLVTEATIPIVPKDSLPPLSLDDILAAKEPGCCAYPSCVATISQTQRENKFCTVHEPHEIIRRAKAVVQKQFDDWHAAEGQSLISWPTDQDIENICARILKDLEGTI